MSVGIWQLVLILAIVFIIFGAGKLPRVMGDIGKGVRSLRDGLKGDEADEAKPEQQKITQASNTTIEQPTQRQHNDL